MAKGSICVLLVLCTLSKINGNYLDGEVEATLFHGNEKLTKIHFYVQETLSGPNATLHEVGRASITSNSVTAFGQVQVFDDLVTAGPNRSSEKLGRAQGILASSDMETPAMTMNINFVFTAGKYSGSTLTVMGRNQFLSQQRELSVVGGTGALRFAHGYAISSITELVTASPGYLTAEYTIYIPARLNLVAHM